MLYIVASSHSTQSQGKRMNQTWKNDKKTSFGTDFDPFDLNLGPQNFFYGFYRNCLLDIIESYHCVQFQEKLINQTGENGWKPSFGPQFWPVLTQILSRNNFFCVGFTSTRCYALLKAIIVWNFKEN